MPSTGFPQEASVRPHAIIVINSISLLQKVELEAQADIRLWKLVRVCCAGHAAVKGYD